MRRRPGMRQYKSSIPHLHPQEKEVWKIHERTRFSGSKCVIVVIFPDRREPAVTVKEDVGVSTDNSFGSPADSGNSTKWTPEKGPSPLDPSGIQPRRLYKKSEVRAYSAVAEIGVTKLFDFANANDYPEGDTTPTDRTRRRPGMRQQISPPSRTCDQGKVVDDPRTNLMREKCKVHGHAPSIKIYATHMCRRMRHL
ncbi:hypothetical protein EVAR_47961_1 [Eumeta japonica]|uniref:Uncharacterized protein n=1 Tax=Eumeta variegata TaxID=151549 RepID=A0A4C1X930_EUMVA|nr:hypothetical protein EVAR_47961_1 [Eumeta japonica]